MTRAAEHPFTGEFEGKSLAIHPNGQTVSALLTENVGQTSSFRPDKVSYSPKRSLLEQANDIIYGKPYKQELLEHYVETAFASFDNIIANEKNSTNSRPYKHHLK